LAYHYKLGNDYTNAFKFDIKSSALAVSSGAFNDGYKLIESSLELLQTVEELDIVIQVCQRAIDDLKLLIFNIMDKNNTAGNIGRSMSQDGHVPSGRSSSTYNMNPIVNTSQLIRRFSNTLYTLVFGGNGNNNGAGSEVNSASNSYYDGNNQNNKGFMNLDDLIPAVPLPPPLAASSPPSNATTPHQKRKSFLGIFPSVYSTKSANAQSENHNSSIYNADMPSPLKQEIILRQNQLYLFHNLKQKIEFIKTQMISDVATLTSSSPSHQVRPHGSFYLMKSFSVNFSLSSSRNINTSSAATTPGQQSKAASSEQHRSPSNASPPVFPPNTNMSSDHSSPLLRHLIQQHFRTNSGSGTPNSPVRVRPPFTVTPRMASTSSYAGGNNETKETADVIAHAKNELLEETPGGPLRGHSSKITWKPSFYPQNKERSHSFGNMDEEGDENTENGKYRKCELDEFELTIVDDSNYPPDTHQYQQQQQHQQKIGGAVTPIPFSQYFSRSSSNESGGSTHNHEKRAFSTNNIEPTSSDFDKNKPSLSIVIPHNNISRETSGGSSTNNNKSSNKNNNRTTSYYRVNSIKRSPTSARSQGQDVGCHCIIS
jgi:hypothetical protein